MTASTWRLMLSAAAVWCVGCHSSPGSRVADSATHEVAGASPHVSAVRLERQPCFGTCPVYTVEIDSSGHVRFEGRAHVKLVGTAEADVGRSAFRAMTERLLQSGFPSLAQSYTAGAEECGNYATDHPVVTMTAVVAGAPKKVVHDYGCSGAPRVLRELHRMIDSVAITSRWLLDS